MTITVAQIRIQVDGDSQGADRALEQVVKSEQRLAQEAIRAANAQNELNGSMLKVNATARDLAVGILAGATGFSLLSAGALAAGRAVEGAFEGIGRAAIGLNSGLETAQLQFAILFKDTGDAAARSEQHIKSLYEFARSTPFEVAPIVEASRLMHTLGGAAFNTSANLTLIGDAAAGATVDIKEIALWVSRAYSAIQAGRPFGEATERLSQLGLMSGTARSEMERLSAAGASSARVWAVLESELKAFEGSMLALQSTWVGLRSTASDSLNLLLSGALKPFFEEGKEQLKQFNAFLETDEATRWGESLRDTLKTDVIPFLKDAAQLARDVTQAVRDIPPPTKPSAEPGGAPEFNLEGALFRATNPAGQAVLLKEQSQEVMTAIGQMKRAWADFNRELAQENQAFILNIQQLYGSQIEDTRLEESLRKGLARAARAAAQAATSEAAPDVEAAGSDLIARYFAAMGIEEATHAMGSDGAELVRALTSAIKDEGEKSLNVVAQASRKLMDTWLKELDPAAAARRGAELEAATVAGLATGDTLGAQALVTSFTTEDRDRKAAETAAREAKRRADEMKREQDAAVREAKRVADEWRRTMPITGENFAAYFGPAAESAAMSAGKGIFDSFTKVIETGGQDAIRAAADVTAGVRQKMLDSFLLDDAEDWARGLTDMVAQAIDQGTPEAIAAVGRYVQAFDIHKQLAEEGQRAAEAINEATDKTYEAINDAERKTAEAIGRLKEDFDLSRRVAIEMERLQEVVRTGMRDARRALEDGERDISLSRESQDRARQLAREDADIERSRGRQQRDIQITGQRAREDLAREHNKRMQEIQTNTSGGREQQAKAIAEAQKQYQERLADLARGEGRGLQDRTRSQADQDADRERARGFAEADRAIRSARQADDRQRQRANEEALDSLQKQLEAPVKQLQLNTQLRGLEQQMIDLRKREREEVDKLNASLQETITKQEAARALMERRLGVQVPSGITNGSPFESAPFVPTGFFPVSPTVSMPPLIPQAPSSSPLDQGDRLLEAVREMVTRIVGDRPLEVNVDMGVKEMEAEISAQRVSRTRSRAIG